MTRRVLDGLDSASHLGIGVDALHHVVTVVGVHVLFPGRVGGLSGGPGAVACQGQAADRHIDGHEGDEQPDHRFPGARWNLGDPAGQDGVEPPEPGHRGEAPEEAVQQVDAPAQVEGNSAVVPEHGAEHQLGKDAAQVLIQAAQQGARHKEKGGRAVPVFVEEQGGGGQGQAPHDAEGAPHHAAAAHPPAHFEAAEDGFGQITGHSADKEQEQDAVKAGPPGKGTDGGPFPPAGKDRAGVGLLNAPLGAAENPLPKPDGEGGQTAV